MNKSANSNSRSSAPHKTQRYRKRILITLFVLSVLVSTTGCHYKKEIPVIGWGSDGNPAQTLIPAKEYSKPLYALTSSVQDSAIPVLNRRVSKTHWKLRSALFGIGVNTELSFGRLFKIGAYPRFRLVFCNTPVCKTP